MALLAEGVEWKSWDAAMAEAQSNDKVIMINVVSDSCRYCKEMDHDVFGDPVMADYIEARFIPVKINLSHNPMPMALEVPMTPTFFFITKEKEVIKMIPGSWIEEDFKVLLDGVE